MTDSKVSPTQASEAAPVEAKPAATIILLRDGEHGLEAQVLQKAPGKHFAGGALVFPGGKVEPGDMAFGGAIGEDRDEYSALKIAAIREMFEECAILLARRPGATRIMDGSEVADCRAARPDTAILDLAASVPFEPAADQLVRFTHWITPPTRPKRFDTHFFIAPAPDGQMTARVDGYEIVDAGWRRPIRMIEEVHAGKLKLVLPTLMNLIKLAKFATVEDALAATRGEDVVCIRPTRVKTSDGEYYDFPAEAGYGEITIPATYLRSA